MKGIINVTKHSPVRASWPLLKGLKVFSRGKVRDTYSLKNGLLLVVATDAISIFDFILNALVPLKGIILTALSVFWFKMMESFGIKTHLMAYGAGIDCYLPKHLRGNTDLQSRALVVRKKDMVDDVEFIVRDCLTGTGKKAYDETGEVCGHKLPKGLQDGDELPCILDTPSTKAKKGHDEHISAASVRAKRPKQTYLAIKIFQIGARYAAKMGIKLCDTKFEFAKDGTLTDEVLTPDSSRFWSFTEWLLSRKPAKDRKAPSAYDKQLARIWGILMGINKLDPKKPMDVKKVHAMVVPRWLIKQLTMVYRYIFWRLTEMTIEQYLRQVMGVRIPELPPKKILIICGSETDVPEVDEMLDIYGSSMNAEIKGHVISCHRNPLELMKFIKGLRVRSFDLIICYGSKAFALPGVVDAWIHKFKKHILVAGVASGDTRSKEFLAAQLSIDEIPGQPVIMDELTGQVYACISGLRDLIHRVDYGELPPPKPRKDKPVRMGIF